MTSVALDGGTKRRRRLTRRTGILLVLLLASALVASFAAWAYFSATGTGTSTLTTGSDGGSVTFVNGTAAGGNCAYTGTQPYVLCVDPITTGLSPGGVTPVNFKVFVTGSGALSPNDLRVGSITATFPSPPVGCTAADFKFNVSAAAAPTSTAAPLLASGWTNGGHINTAGTNYTAVGYIHYDNTGVDQSGCKSKAIPVSWAMG